MLIGKSMSLCVRDILKRLVPLSDVILLDAGTKIDSCETLTGVISFYHTTYWSDWSIDECTKIVEKILFTNRLRQERVIHCKEEHLKRSVKLHEDKFGEKHSPGDVMKTFENETYRDDFNLGSHWEIKEDH